MINVIRFHGKIFSLSLQSKNLMKRDVIEYNFECCFIIIFCLLLSIQINVSLSCSLPLFDLIT